MNLTRRARRSQFPAAREKVILCDQLAVGSCVTVAVPQALRLIEIALLPAWRGRGIGTAVLDHLLAQADRDGYPIRLFVYRSNPRADALYRRLGFTETGADELMVELERPPAAH